MNDIISQNKASRNAVADDQFGVTTLFAYVCLCPNENELHFCPKLAAKKMLDMGCGSDHDPKLFNPPMEQNSGLPKACLDVA